MAVAQTAVNVFDASLHVLLQLTQRDKVVRFSELDAELAIKILETESAHLALVVVLDLPVLLLVAGFVHDERWDATLALFSKAG